MALSYSVGFVLGLLASVLGVAIAAMLDNTIHDEDYILQNYDIPVLAKVPNLMHSGGKKYSNYNYYYHYKNKSNQ